MAMERLKQWHAGSIAIGAVAFISVISYVRNPEPVPGEVAASAIMGGIFLGITYLLRHWHSPARR